MLTGTGNERESDRTTVSLWQRLRDGIRRRRLYTATLRRLRTLPQAELDEMGISRGMVSRVAFEIAYGRRK